jgi:hypothetical protein
MRQAPGGRWEIRCQRSCGDEVRIVPADEAEWAEGSWRRMSSLFWWHRDYGLQRRTPHPMGKDLDLLLAAWKAEDAERYRRVGMAVPAPYRPEEPVPDGTVAEPSPSPMR